MSADCRVCHGEQAVNDEGRWRSCAACSNVLDECIEWTGARNERGYGVVRYKGRPWLAHRAAYDECVGPIPDGMFVLHRCDNPPCVNPEHLMLGDHAENMRQAVARGRTTAALGRNWLANKTECKRGHEFTPENTYRYPDGRRSCRECMRMHDRAYHAKARGQAVLS